MYRWFGVVPQGCVVLFSSFFLVILGALCGDFLGGVLRMISWGFYWVSRMRTLCLFGWLLCPQMSLESDSIWWFFKLLEFLARGNPAFPKVPLQSVV
jgi:hypothetical protein